MVCMCEYGLSVVLENHKRSVLRRAVYRVDPYNDLGLSGKI